MHAILFELQQCVALELIDAAVMGGSCESVPSNWNGPASENSASWRHVHYSPKKFFQGTDGRSLQEIIRENVSAVYKWQTNACIPFGCFCALKKNRKRVRNLDDFYNAALYKKKRCEAVHRQKPAMILRLRHWEWLWPCPHGQISNPGWGVMLYLDKE